MLKALVSTALVSTVLMVSVTVPGQAQTRRSPRVNPAPVTVRTTPVIPSSLGRIASPHTDGTGKLETTCTGVQSCNDFIALCVASGGEFEGTAHDPQGRPSAGTCYSDD